MDATTTDLDRTATLLAELCSREEGIVAAYLFGSAASRTMRPASDLDVAILLDPGHEDSFPVLAFAATLERECGCPVDLVVLNRAGEVLKHQVRRHGLIIFDRNPAARKAFEIKSRRLYEDFLYLHGNYIRRVLYGRPGYGKESAG